MIICLYFPTPIFPSVANIFFYLRGCSSEKRIEYHNESNFESNIYKIIDHCIDCKRSTNQLSRLSIKTIFLSSLYFLQVKILIFIVIVNSMTTMVYTDSLETLLVKVSKMHLNILNNQNTPLKLLKLSQSKIRRWSTISWLKKRDSNVKFSVEFRHFSAGIISLAQGCTL